MARTLSDQCQDWQRWAADADDTEEGWQSDYPAWRDLMNAAAAAMTGSPVTGEAIKDIELCWAISEETEDMADFARENIEECWQTLSLLAQSSVPQVRWQVYSVLGLAGGKAEDLLRAGLEDPDAYCRRQAILSLARLSPADARELADRFAQDPDPYIRQASAQLLNSSASR